MSERDRDRPSKRRSRQEDAPDPDDRYDPKQGAKRSRRDDESSDIVHTSRQAKDDLDFSDRYEPQSGRQDTSRSRSKERPSHHSSREHREHKEHRERDSSRSHHNRGHHSAERAPADRPRLTDSRGGGASELHSPRQSADAKGDPADQRPAWQAPDFGTQASAGSDRGGFGRGNFIAGRGLGRGRGFDSFQGRGQGLQDTQVDGMADGGRGGRGGFIPRGRFGARFGGRFEGAGGRMDGRFDSFRGRGAFPYRGRGGRGFPPNSDSSQPAPFSRGQDGPIEGVYGRGPMSGRGGFPVGGRGPPSGGFPRRQDSVLTERQRVSSQKRLRQQVSQLRIVSDLIPERHNDKFQLLLKPDAESKDAVLKPSVPPASAYMYAALHHDQLGVAGQVFGGVDRTAFEVAVELCQRPQAAQWTRTSSHGTFILTSTQIMANI